MKWNELCVERNFPRDAIHFICADFGGCEKNLGFDF
jgi:hypothetical protein